MHTAKGRITREQRERITVRALNNNGPLSGIAEDVRAGFSAYPKFLPPKYFYDERGSWLFDQICRTREYYPTQTEDALLAGSAHAVIKDMRPQSILELGSGSSRKTVHLLEACEVLECYARYLPFDVCAEMLAHAGERLLREYRWLTVEAIVGDYCRDLGQIPNGDGARLFVFLGGTIGNFHEDEAVNFLRNTRSVMAPGDRLLLGADRIKDVQVLHDAYNDALGLTADFNLNVLNVVNRELAGEFDVGKFDHRAWFNESQARIEMHLRSRVAQKVRIRDLHMEVAFAEGESILTEVSRKFTPATLDTMLSRSGFVAEQHFAPENGYFSLVLARPCA